MEGTFTVKCVAERLDVSERSVRQLIKKLAAHGEDALLHGNHGKKPVNYISDDVRKRIVALKKSNAYVHFSFAAFRKALFERKGIEISYTAMSDILKAAGICPKARRQPAQGGFRRRASAGELLHMESRMRDWFGDGIGVALHLLVDDATENITGMRFCRCECATGYLLALRRTIEEYGCPDELRIDTPGLLCVAADRSARTPLGSILFTLVDTAATEGTCAPHVRRRLDRLWVILQNGLPRWLKRHGIADIDEANLKLAGYAALFNKKHGVTPRSDRSVFVPLIGEDLDGLLGEGSANAPTGQKEPIPSTSP